MVVAQAEVHATSAVSMLGPEGVYGTVFDRSKEMEPSGRLAQVRLHGSALERQRGYDGSSD